MKFTETQIQRLHSLGRHFDEACDFASADERNAAFKEYERAATSSNRASLRAMRYEETRFTLRLSCR